MIKKWEHMLDSFDAGQRRKVLQELWTEVQQGKIQLPPAGSDINLHGHTFFSYNAYGYSPSKFAWLARKTGLAMAGIVDFDVLDGLDEFVAAGNLLNLKSFVGMETRVFVPEFAELEMTSPGEPGITYHMGVGFPSAPTDDKNRQFLHQLRQMAQQRNMELMRRVNRFLDPVMLDYQADVLPLTPSGNATERHMCLAYARKAQAVFPDQKQLAAFWSEKLAAAPNSLELPEGASLLNTIRSKLMKRGGVGYVQPDQGSFPKMAETNQFLLSAGAIPTLTWLNGFSAGEKKIEQLLQVAMSTGVAAINIIPDRNYTPGVEDEKVANLYHIVEVAEKLQLPVVVGTEMNSPGQKFVDDFRSRELQRLLSVFLKGGYIVYAHSLLQRQCGLGYTSPWASHVFANTKAKNDFFEQIGRQLQPVHQQCLTGFDANATPKQILKKIE